LKIYIVGCAKSGTWLLLWLFSAFENIHTLDYESERKINYVQDFKLNKGQIGVWKRTWNMAFSHHRDEIVRPPLQKQLEIFQENDISVVYIRRKKEDVLKSDGGWVSENRYDDCEKQAIEYSEYIKCFVDYDDLLKNPDKVQKIITKSLNLKIKNNWSDFPDFVPDEAFNVHKGANYSKRRLGEKY